MSLFVLPPELIDAIIDCLHDDEVSLKACSTIARDFRVTSQKHLFARVVLPPAPSSKNGKVTPTQKLKGLLTSSPHIQHLVRDMDLPGGGYGVSWVSDDFSQLASILSSMSRLRKLAWGGRQASWSSLPHPLQTSLEGVFRSSFLVHLELSNFPDIPFTALALCSSLRHLTLSSCSFLPASNVELASSPYRLLTTPRAQLETLCLSLSCEVLPSVVHWLAHPQCTLDIHSLRRLAVDADCNQMDHSYIWCLLQACSTSLEEFRFAPAIEYSIRDIAPLDPIDLGCLTNLRTLRLQLDELDSWDANIIPWLCRFLNTLPTNNVVNAIWLDCAFGFYDEAIHRNAWECVDHLLTGPSFSRLKLAHLSMHGHHFMAGAAEQATGVESVMTGLRSKGILQVGTSDLGSGSKRRFDILKWQ